jgi:hypothetical protein
MTSNNAREGGKEESEKEEETAPNQIILNQKIPTPNQPDLISVPYHAQTSPTTHTKQSKPNPAHCPTQKTIPTKKKACVQ